MNIPTKLKIDNEMSRQDQLEQNAKEAVERLNESSQGYRDTVTGINDKLIVIALGSISLLLTFLGVLVSSEGSFNNLEYKYLVVSICLLLASSALMLLSRYFQSRYVFNIRFKFYVNSEKERHTSHLRIAQLQTNIISENHKQMTPKERNRFMDDLTIAITNRDKEITKATKHEEIFNKLQKYSNYFAYISIIVGYVFTLIFFIGVINILNVIS